MPAKLKLTQLIYEKMLAHLVDMEEKHFLLADEYYPELNRERDEFMAMMHTYISMLDSTVRKASVSEDSGNEFPFVCIFSEVEVEDLQDGEIIKYRIIPPETDDLQKEDEITYLSPVGKALMLKKKGETAVVTAPLGTYKYRVKAIKLF